MTRAMGGETSMQVYFSYHDEDAAAAEDIARRLRDEKSIDVWLDSWSILPGQLTLQEKERGLAASQACVILIGSTGVAQWQTLDVYASIAKRVEADGSDFPVIPTFLPECTVVQSQLPTSLRLYEPVRFPTLDDEAALDRLAHGILGEPPGDRKPDPQVPCPFPGLDPFAEAFVRFFFGRDEELDQLTKILTETQLVAVIGPSGSGKSSLVRAGLVAQLRRKSPEPLIRVLSPGKEPLQRAATCLRPRLDPDQRNSLVDELRGARSEWPRTIDATLQIEGRDRLVLVVDQLEEIFTLCNEEDDRRAFIEGLATAAEQDPKRVKVVFVLRSDFLTPCFRYAPLIDRTRQMLITPLEGDKLRSVIEKSSEAAGLWLQRGLAETIIAEARNEPGIQPLVQYALLELFKRRSGRWLTLKAYFDEGVGGVRGVVSARGDAALSKLRRLPGLPADEVEQTARRVLLRMVHLTEAGDPIRQEVKLDDFYWASDTPRQRELIRTALDVFIEERLLTSDKQVVTLAHEIVLRAWPVLASWVDTYRSDLLIRSRIEARARAWHQTGRTTDRLLRGDELSEAREWLRRRVT